MVERTGVAISDGDSMYIHVAPAHAAAEKVRFFIAIPSRIPITLEFYRLRASRLLGSCPPGTPYRCDYACIRLICTMKRSLDGVGGSKPRHVPLFCLLRLDGWGACHNDFPPVLLLVSLTSQVRNKSSVSEIIFLVHEGVTSMRWCFQSRFGGPLEGIVAFR